MNIPINEDWMTAAQLATFIPMVATSILVALCFNRAGYGWVGRLLVGGFGVLVLSLFTSIMYNVELDMIYRSASNITRVLGWSLVAAGFAVWYLELDRSLP